MAGIPEPESVAEHCFRCAIIGYYLAHLEKVDAFQVLVMTLFNDIHESRINDLHKMGHYYIDFKEAEKKVFEDQVRNLHPSVKSELSVLRGSYDKQNSKEAVVARDADILECLLQAKEYKDHGHGSVERFFHGAPSFLKTKSAKMLWQKMKKWDSTAWWHGITKFER